MERTQHYKNLPKMNFKLEDLYYLILGWFAGGIAWLNVPDFIKNITLGNVFWNHVGEAAWAVFIAFISGAAALAGKTWWQKKGKNVKVFAWFFKKAARRKRGS